MSQPESELDVFMRQYAERSRKLNRLITKFNNTLKIKKD